MRHGAVLLEHEPIIASGALAAQATCPDGFRQRDMRFFVELFSNWLQSTTGLWAMNIHNTQVQRYLTVLSKAGFARRPGRRPPRYRLTPEGLIELLTRLTHRPCLRPMDEFFLVFHILKTYGGRLRDMLEQTNELSSKTLALDVDELLDPQRYLERERSVVQHELKRLALRSSESLQTSELSRQLFADGKALPEVVAAVQRQYPYELNSQRPLDELLEGLPLAWRRFELDEAAEARSRQLWQPIGELLQAHDRILAELSKLP